jgi:hypothetical protein
MLHTRSRNTKICRINIESSRRFSTGTVQSPPHAICQQTVQVESDRKNLLSWCDLPSANHQKKSLEKEIKTAQMAHVTYGGETLLGCSEMQVRDLLIAAHHSDWDFPEHMLRKMQVLLPEFVAIVT